MQGCFPRLNVFGSFVLSLAVGLTSNAAEAPLTWVDDALLHDVHFVGSKIAVAVGEHGAIWRSDDGGRSFNRQSCGMDVSLRSICLLTDQVGWIAGGTVMAHSAFDGGVMFSTRDGGKTWTQIGQGTLSPLTYVKFFNLDEGVAVGQPTPVGQSGIFKTSDGGQTWRGVPGDAPQAWKAACFLEPEMGAVAGATSRVSIMGGEQLFPSKLPARGFRSIQAISISSNDQGWLAGDGGLVLHSSTGGVVWESPAKPLPDELRDGMDFRAVEVRGQKVWLTGSPGSVVWHSPDGGNRWIKQSTGQPVPLTAMRFANDQIGLAVGTFGTIIRTEDGGRTWESVRGGGRRAALLSLHARPGQTTAPLLTKLSGEQGYRSAVWIAQRNDVGPLAIAADGDARLQTAVQKCGGNAADIHWQLPLTIPGVEYSSEKLLAEWQKQTEGRLPQTMLGGLVRQIRTWRPNILVIDQPSADDAACQLLFDATLRAVEQAADSTRFVEQTELTGLEAWNVDRIYVRLAPGATGDSHIDLDEFLPYLRSSTRIASSVSIGLLQPGRIPQSDIVESPRIAYRWIGMDGKPADDSKSKKGGGASPGSRSRDFFGGLAITPGSAARRATSSLDEANLDKVQKLVQKQRNFAAITRQSLDDPRVSGQMLAQLGGIIEGMDDQQAAIVLCELADEYRKRSQFEMAEATYVELVRQFPREPGSVDAARWLIQFWSSSETAWQRSRTMTSTTTVSRVATNQRPEYVDPSVAPVDPNEGGVRPAAASNGGDQFLQGKSNSPVRLATKFDFDEAPARGANKNSRLKISAEEGWRTGAIGEWQTRAIELARKLEKNSPSLYRSPEIQFPLAALRRAKGSSRAADEIMRSFVSNGIDSETRDLAQRELWTSYATPDAPQAIAHCKQAGARPHLDGLLSDPCWEAANEVHLSARPASSEALEQDGDRSMVMFAYDDQYLYVALSAPRAAGAPRDLPQTRGRKHDADLTRHDRFSIRLDIDRDYFTWYEFQVDQRGWTSESCWEDRRWNPNWYVAAEADETDWRIEAAIPWNDLTPNPPRPGTIYGISMLRTIPGVGLQSWTQPAVSKPQPSAFGFLKFE